MDSSPEVGKTQDLSDSSHAEPNTPTADTKEQDFDTSIETENGAKGSEKVMSDEAASPEDVRQRRNVQEQMHMMSASDSLKSKLDDCDTAFTKVHRLEPKAQVYCTKGEQLVEPLEKFRLPTSEYFYTLKTTDGRIDKSLLLEELSKGGVPPIIQEQISNLTNMRKDDYYDFEQYSVAFHLAWSSASGNLLPASLRLVPRGSFIVSCSGQLGYDGSLNMMPTFVDSTPSTLTEHPGSVDDSQSECQLCCGYMTKGQNMMCRKCVCLYHDVKNGDRTVNENCNHDLQSITGQKTIRCDACLVKKAKILIEREESSNTDVNTTNQSASEGRRKSTRSRIPTKRYLD